jgi:uncharacterized protein YndB with AHSA1/START domain
MFPQKVNNEKRATMTLNFELLINKNRHQVWQAFDNPDNLLKWQPTLKTFKHESGDQGQVDAVSKLVYEENGREIHMTETITVRNELEEFSGKFEAQGAINTMVNRFKVVDESTTKWQIECQIEFSGAIKFFSSLIKKSINKRLNNDMVRFKTLVEEGAI